MSPGKIRSRAQEILADRQMRRWELQHRSAGESPRSPCVALTRLPGAGGAEVGRLVAKYLDYGFFGRELVDEIARELDLAHWIVADLDERVRGAIDRFVGDVLGSDRFTEDDYLRRVKRIVATLGSRGSAVLVGRGAPFLLAKEQALRVFVTAPRPQRIERYASVLGLDPARAQAELDRVEGERAEFARKQFDVRHDDTTLYDLVLNTGSLSFEAAAALTVEALRRRFPT